MQFLFAVASMGIRTAAGSKNKSRSVHNHLMPALPGNTFANSHQQELNLHPARHVQTHICGIEPRCPAALPIELQWHFIIPYKPPVYSCIACSLRYTHSLQNNDPQLFYFRNGALDTPTTTPHGVCLISHALKFLLAEASRSDICYL